MIANQAVDGWDALADSTRRAIVASLAEGPRAVGELAAGLPVTRPAVSQHLKILKTAGLVTDRAEGTRRIYQLNPLALAALRDVVLEPAQRSHLARVEDHRIAHQPQLRLAGDLPFGDEAAEVARYQAELAQGRAGTTTTTPSKESR